MRQCSICQLKKPETAEFFYRSKSQRGGLHPECKSCSKKRDKVTNKRYYNANKATKTEKVNNRRLRIRSFILQYKSGRTCSNCPESRPEALDFHHLEPSSKTTNVAWISKRGWSTERTIAELSKCKLLCANCHRIEDRQFDLSTNEESKKKRDRLEELKKIGCKKCGEDRCAVLDFHHRDRDSKVFNIGTNVSRKTLTALLREAAKCDILCANCHRAETANENSRDYRCSH